MDLPANQPLPPNDYNPGSREFRAYDMCVQLEASPQAVAQLVKGTKRTVLVCARLLGYLIKEAPVDTGRSNVLSEIIDCNEDGTKLQMLANNYIDHLFRCFRAIKGRTPAPSDTSSASLRAARDCNLPYLVGTPASHATAKKHALRRDSYRCMLTGNVDDASFHNNLTTQPPGYHVVPTCCAHIFDRSTNEDINKSDKVNYAASVHAMVDRFGGVPTRDEYNGARVHRLENVLTLETWVHKYFDSLWIWLEKKPGDGDSWYTVQAVHPAYRERIPQRVHFQSSDPEQYPLPDPRLLAIHAACARVAHLSGAAECLDEIQRDMDDISVLSDDGSSESALYNAFVRKGISVY